MQANAISLVLFHAFRTYTEGICFFDIDMIVSLIPIKWEHPGGIFEISVVCIYWKHAYGILLSRHFHAYRAYHTYFKIQLIA